MTQLGALLKQHKLASPHSRDSDYVFSTALGTPLSARNVERRGLGRAADRAGLNPEELPRLLFDRAAHAADIRERMAVSEFGALLALAPAAAVSGLQARGEVKA